MCRRLHSGHCRWRCGRRCWGLSSCRCLAVQLPCVANRRCCRVLWLLQLLALLLGGLPARPLQLERRLVEPACRARLLLLLLRDLLDAAFRAAGAAALVIQVELSRCGPRLVPLLLQLVLLAGPAQQRRLSGALTPHQVRAAGAAGGRCSRGCLLLHGARSGGTRAAGGPSRRARNCCCCMQASFAPCAWFCCRGRRLAVAGARPC
jgi:hypothetical protein